MIKSKEVSNGNTIGLEGSYLTSSEEEKEISDVWFKYENQMIMKQLV